MFIKDSHKPAEEMVTLEQVCVCVCVYMHGLKEELEEKKH
jgi:hypothetical protein